MLRTSRVATIIGLTLVLALITFGMGGTPAVEATPLAPFIDLQEQGLTLVVDGVGLESLGGSSVNLTVNIGGTVRFALLYWAGRDIPCPETSLGSGTCAAPPEPYKDQQIVFNGSPITGTFIGTEGQPSGLVNNIGFFCRCDIHCLRCGGR